MSGYKPKMQNRQLLNVDFLQNKTIGLFDKKHDEHKM